MNKFINWKSLTLLLTIAGLLIPVWIWRSDVNSKSLQFRVNSLVSLQSETAPSISGLQISVDGIPLKSPYITVLELTNSGDRPISTSDFEAPLELRPQEGAVIVRASITSVSPKDVKAIIETKAELLELKPMLLNPKDSVTISILSSGVRPVYTVSSRIVGIASVPIIYETSTVVTWLNNVLLLIGSVLLFASSSMVSDGLTKKAFVLRKRAILLISTVTGFSGFVFFMDFLNGIGIHNLWLTIAAFAPFILVTTVISVYWNWPASTSQNSSN